MEIVISAVCPHCKQKIELKSSLGVITEEQMEYLNSSFDLAKTSSKKAMEKEPDIEQIFAKKSFLDGIYCLPKPEEKNMSPVERGITTMDTYFKDIFFDLKAAKNKQELEEVKKQLEAKHLGIAKPLISKFLNTKEQLMEMIDKRLKELSKKEPKKAKTKKGRKHKK